MDAERLKYHFMGLVRATKAELGSQVSEEHFGILVLLNGSYNTCIDFLLVFFALLLQDVGLFAGQRIDK